MSINKTIQKIKGKVSHRYLRAKKKLNAFFKVAPKVFSKSKTVESDFDLGGNVKLYYYKLYEDTNESVQSENLGDYLSKIVVSHFAPKTSGNNKTPRTLYGIGSILGFRCQDCVVWGSGIIGYNEVMQFNFKFSSYDIRAVRGPKTREYLLGLGKNCPEVYGDPAILMPRIFMPENLTKKHKVSLVLHYKYNDFDIPENMDINILNIVTTDYEDFITQIAQSELVISSSLHGVILAESYGVPAVLLQKADGISFKYEDWYNSTGRYDIVFARSIEEALTVKPMELPNLTKMQDGLINAFPYDLWEDSKKS